MPTGFDQLSMQYSRPPPGRPGPPPTPPSNQNADRFLNSSGQSSSSQGNPSGPGQLQHSPHGQVQQHQTPGPALRTPGVDYGGEYFQNVEQVKAYIQELAWWPSMGTFGFPRTVAERKYYLDILKAAISSTADVWDKDIAPGACAKFTQYVDGDELLNGEWTGPKDIEAAAIAILSIALKIHAQGVTGLAFRQSIDYTYHYVEDLEFTFTQRIHFVAWLLKHSKVAAALVMATQCIDKFVAIPFTTLMYFKNFSDEWTLMFVEEKHNFAELIPYEDVDFNHPTEEEQTQLRERTGAAYKNAKAREAGFRDEKEKAEFEAVQARGLYSSQAGPPEGQASGKAFDNNNQTRPALQHASGSQGHNQSRIMESYGRNSAPLGSSTRPRNASSPTGRAAQPQEYGGESPAPRGAPNPAQNYAEGPRMF
jgi:hypothetical protein